MLPCEVQEYLNQCQSNDPVRMVVVRSRSPQSHFSSGFGLCGCSTDGRAWIDCGHTLGVHGEYIWNTIWDDLYCLGVYSLLYALCCWGINIAAWRCECLDKWPWMTKLHVGWNEVCFRTVHLPTYWIVCFGLGMFDTYRVTNFVSSMNSQTNLVRCTVIG